ncbi:MAG: cobalamin-independent methionine synthase II family protein [Candidatus Dormibacteraeota bacterium]|nr:cobalamin-independent methionine synthase II family protein [Candidatus Dormibacteraeota bacterium]
MLTATRDLVLPTTITGSLPRPAWYTESLGPREFLDAMVSRSFREQYLDALTVHLAEQERAGLDILTDGDTRFDDDVGGQSWSTYPPWHMTGFDHTRPLPTRAGSGGVAFPRGHILHDYLEGRVMPGITGPVGRGSLQYTALWKTAQRLTNRPVKFGAVSAEVVGFAVQDAHYRSVPERILALADAFNEEYHELADAGCPVIQIEEPQLHLIRARGIVSGEITPQLLLEAFARTVRGLREKTEVWAHTCWGNPSQQRMFATPQSYAPALEDYNQIDADVVTFECCSSGGMDVEAIGKTVTDRKVAIGVIDHHTLQVETPEQVAEQIRAALRFIPAERLVISSDCGMGREGMSRRHAFYKVVSLVLGTNLVRRELGLPEADILESDGRYSLVAPAAS